MFHDFATTVLDFISTHRNWMPLIVGLLAFGESLAFVSLLIPATFILFGTSALIGQLGISVWPVWLAAFVGAALGDWVSYWIGRYFGPDVCKMWPLSKQPNLIPRGHAFFERFGIWAVFLGRFFGPLRAGVPLVAGICDMPQRQFQLANIASAALWAFGILVPGAYGMSVFSQ